MKIGEMFTKKPNSKKLYLLSEALKLITEHEGYTTLPEQGKDGITRYRIVKEYTVADYIEETKYEYKETGRKAFESRLSQEGQFKGIEANNNTNSLNNWQNTKKYNPDEYLR